MMVIAGLCWFAAALGFGFLLVQYLAQGAGLQVFGFYLGVSSSTVLLGLAHVVGFAAAAFLCFAIGVGFCAHGLVPPPKPEQEVPEWPIRRFAFLRQNPAVPRSREEDNVVLRCVRCRTSLADPVRICPECGWTQPYGGQ